jgi:hypothetical protein
VIQYGRADQDGDAGTVLPHVLLLERRALAAPAELVDSPLVQGGVLGRRHLPPLQAPGLHVLARVADDAEKRVVGVEDALGIREQDADGRRRHDAPEPLLARPDRLLGPLALGHVVDDEHHGPRAGVAHRADGHLDVEELAFLRPVARRDRAHG